MNDCIKLLIWNAFLNKFISFLNAKACDMLISEIQNAKIKNRIVDITHEILQQVRLTINIRFINEKNSELMRNERLLKIDVYTKKISVELIEKMFGVLNSL